MGQLIITKDIGLGEEKQVEVNISLCLAGTSDSSVDAHLLHESKKATHKVSYDRGVFILNIVEKIPKKTVTSEKGEPLEVCYVSYFICSILQGDMLKSINKSVGDDGVAQLIHCDLLFMAMCLDACERSCKTVFPWYIGSHGSIAAQLAMLDLMTARDDFVEQTDTRKEDVEAVAGATVGTGGAAGAVAGAAMAATGVAQGAITAESLATTAHIAAHTAATAVKSTVNVGSIGWGLTMAEFSASQGATTAATFGIAVGATAAPIALVTAGIGLAIMGYKGYTSFVNSKALKINLSIIQKYAELVQRGNIGKYCATNDLRFHEIWSELAEKCEICGAEDIFDLESKIAVLL